MVIRVLEKERINTQVTHINTHAQGHIGMVQKVVFVIEREKVSEEKLTAPNHASQDHINHAKGENVKDGTKQGV